MMDFSFYFINKQRDSILTKKNAYPHAALLKEILMDR